jgi:hypothetical protein
MKIDYISEDETSPARQRTRLRVAPTRIASTCQSGYDLFVVRSRPAIKSGGQRMAIPKLEVTEQRE